MKRESLRSSDNKENREPSLPSFSLCHYRLSHKQKNICMWSKIHSGGKNSEDFCVLYACSWGRKSLCVLPPGPPLTHNAVLLFGNKYSKDSSKGRQRMKMKKRVGARRASERGHGSAGSAVSPRCWMVFWCWELGVGLVFNVMQLWRWSVWSYAWVGLISSFFLICFCFFPPSLSSLGAFFFFFLWETQLMCLKWGNVSRVSAEAPIVVVVFAVLKP